MKYIIDIPDDNISDFLTLGDNKRLRLPIYNKNGTFNSFIPTNLIVTPYTEPDHKAIELQHAHDIENVARLNYNKGAEDGWDFAKLFALTSEEGGTSINELQECFGYNNRRAILRSNSYQEAKAKYEKWKKQEDEIRVGYEVEYPPNKAKGIVVQCHVPDVYAEVDKYAVFTGASVEYLPIEWLTKTGRHFPEVEELLKKIKE